MYAELLLNGDKTVELRRIRPQAEPGTLVIVYATSPLRAVLGTCIVKTIGTEAPNVIWDLHGPKTGIPRRDFDTYFQGSRRAVAITVTNPRRLAQPIPLDALREDLGSFTPPQSFRYLTADQARTLFPTEWAHHCQDDRVLANLTN